LRSLKHAALVGVLLLSACALRPSVKTKSVGVEVVQGANDQSPVEVEFVAVRDEELLATLLELTARDWFTRREQLKSDYPKELQTVSWEFVPGQRVAPRKLGLKRRGAKAILVFANYAAAGTHRQRADPFKKIVVRLAETDFTIEESK
jgi:type VI secretion system protein